MVRTLRGHTLTRNRRTKRRRTMRNISKRSRRTKRNKRSRRTKRNKRNISKRSRRRNRSKMKGGMEAAPSVAAPMTVPMTAPMTVPSVADPKDYPYGKILLDYYDKLPDTRSFFWKILCDMMRISIAICPSDSFIEINNHFEIILDMSFRDINEYSRYSIIFPFLLSTFVHHGKIINGLELIIFYDIIDELLSREEPGIIFKILNRANMEISTMANKYTLPKDRLAYVLSGESTWSVYISECEKYKDAITPSFTEDSYNKNMKSFNSEEFGWLRRKMGIFGGYSKINVDLFAAEIAPFFKDDTLDEAKVEFTENTMKTYLEDQKTNIKKAPPAGFVKLCNTPGKQVHILHNKVFTRRGVRLDELPLNKVKIASIIVYNIGLKKIGLTKSDVHTREIEAMVNALFKIIFPDDNVSFSRVEFENKCNEFTWSINEDIRHKLDEMEREISASEARQAELLAEEIQEETDAAEAMVLKTKMKKDKRAKKTLHKKAFENLALEVQQMTTSLEASPIIESSITSHYDDRMEAQGGAQGDRVPESIEIISSIGNAVADMEAAVEAAVEAVAESVAEAAEDEEIDEMTTQLYIQGVVTFFPEVFTRVIASLEGVDKLLIATALLDNIKEESTKSHSNDSTALDIAASNTISELMGEAKAGGSEAGGAESGGAEAPVLEEAPPGFHWSNGALVSDAAPHVVQRTMTLGGSSSESESED